MKCSRFRTLLRRNFGLKDEEHPEYYAWSRHTDSCRACGDIYLRRLMRMNGIQTAGQPCIHLAYRVGQKCKGHPDPMDCPDAVVVYSPTFREWGIPVRDGPRARAYEKISFTHCPWCGIELPRSLRYAWFDALEALGIDDPWGEPRRVPKKYKSDAWWRADPARFGGMRPRRTRPAAPRRRRAPTSRST